MDLTPIRHAIDQVVFLRNSYFLKLRQGVIERALEEANAAAGWLAMLNEDDFSEFGKELFQNLGRKLTEVGLTSQYVEEIHKTSRRRIDIPLKRWNESLNNVFARDIMKAYVNVEFDSNLINQLICDHFYRAEDLGFCDVFVMEAQIELGVAAALHAPVSDMWQYLKQLREMNVDPALDWCDANRLKLDARASSLEFELRELKFHHLHKTKGLNVAVEYGKSFVSSYIAEHDYVKSKFPNYGNQHIQRTNVNRMMASLLWNKRGGNSPYKTYFDMHQQLQSTCEKFKREYLLNHRFQSALHAVVSAGSMALLVLLGISSKVQEWELDDAYNFHSIYVCCVHLDQSTVESPPVLQQSCGHTMCLDCFQRMPKNSLYVPRVNTELGVNIRITLCTLICPFCRSLTGVVECKKIYM
ncbi:protein RMD5 homolog isoform X1 [Physcomitrium patens]|uniref:CTLH domain-containing protein n=1 Tax=Physcomitrium patens TaxID=3218 RepID=A0A7I4AF04_PHYPA